MVRYCTRWRKFLQEIYPFYNGIAFNLNKLETVFELDECEEELETVDLKGVEDELLKKNEEQKEREDELEYITKDAVRKHQTDTSGTSLLLPENIECKIKTRLRNKKEAPCLILAPGEDQIPCSILKEKHPFVRHFPSLFPDGKGGLHDEDRKRKIEVVVK